MSSVRGCRVEIFFDGKTRASFFRPTRMTNLWEIPADERAARTGRNPQTGMEINIKAARVPKFRPGKALKDAVN